MKQLKVLNIAQPNAHNVIFNGKNIENRNMPSSYRGTIAIYASQTYNKERFEDQNVKRDECKFGFIIGLVDIVDCLVESEITETNKTWFNGPYGYLFENIIPLDKPIKVTPPQGAVVWWNLEEKDTNACLAQLKPDQKVTPVFEFKKDFKGKKPKTVSSMKFNPSIELGLIVGHEPISYKQAINKYSAYIDDNEFFEERDGELIIIADKNLETLLRKRETSLQDAVEIIKKNLSGFCD